MFAQLPRRRNSMEQREGTMGRRTVRTGSCPLLVVRTTCGDHYDSILPTHVKNGPRVPRWPTISAPDGIAVDEELADRWSQRPPGGRRTNCDDVE